MAALLVTSWALLERFIAGALASLIPVLCLLPVYYIGYVRWLRSSSRRREAQWLDELFSPWGVVAFGSVFSLALILLGAWANSAFNGMFFGAASVESVAMNFVQNVLGFGLFEVLGYNPSGIEPQAVGARFFIWSSTVLFKVSIIGAAAGVLKDIWESRRQVEMLFANGGIGLRSSPRQIQYLAREYQRRASVDAETERDLVRITATSTSRAARDLVLLIAQRTRNPATAEACGAYFHAVPDKRYQRLARKQGGSACGAPH